MNSADYRQSCITNYVIELIWRSMLMILEQKKIFSLQIDQIKMLIPGTFLQRNASLCYEFQNVMETLMRECNNGDSINVS